MNLIRAYRGKAAHTRVLASVVCAMALLGGRPDGVPAQATGPLPPAEAVLVPAQPELRPQVSVGWPVAIGVLGGAAGAFIGGVGGYFATRGGDCYEDCGLVGAAAGFIAGETIGLSLGVHLGNSSRGNYMASLLASVATGLAGVAILGLTNSPEAAWVAIPIVQVGATVAIQRWSARSRAR